MKPRGHLPQLADHVSELETCVYCPKLCRAACPVAQVAASETLTPWGKMSLAFFAHRGDVPLDAAHALPIWACTRCDACRHRCEHDTDVATVLTDARAALGQAGLAPEGAQAVRERWPRHRAAVRERLDALGAAAQRTGPTALLIGCSYVRYSPAVVEDLLAVAARLLGGAFRLPRQCCGLPLLLAGDQEGFERAAHDLAAELRGAERVIVVDPGCARTLVEQYPRCGIELGDVSLLVDEVAGALDQLPSGVFRGETFRYLDPCQFARGLGRSDEPRAILAHLTGQEPLGFVRSRADGECSGGGGLLPLTYPELSRAIADERIAEHQAAGGGRLVTACGSSLHRLRSRGAPVVDLMSLVAQALG